MKYLITLIFVFSCSTVYAQAVATIRSHNQLTGTGANSHAILDDFVSSKGQANGLASLDASGNLVQSAGTVTLSGGYVQQTNGTATGTQLTSVQINSGTGTLSAATIAGVAAPYIAQTNGTGTVSTITSTGNVNLIKDGQNRMIIKRSTIGSDALSLFMISVYGSDTTGAETNFANIEASIGSATDNQESGKIALWTMRDGFIDERLSITGTSAAFGGTGNKVDVDVYGTITARDGVKFPDNSTLLSGNIVKGIVAGSGISIDQSTGTVTINASGSTGGWTDGTNTVYTTVAADQVIIGSTTASGSNILTVVGSATVNDLSISNALGVSFTGTPVVDLAIGDNDTGLNYVSDGIYDIMANNNSVVRIDGNIPNRISVGTTTMGTTVNVSGTVTATGFSGVVFGAVTGTPTDNSNFSATPGTNKVPYTGTSTNLNAWIDNTIISIPGTTTAITGTSANGRWYNLQESAIVYNADIMLHANSPGTTSVTDSSAPPHAFTAYGSAIGTTTAKFGSGGFGFTSVGTTDYIDTPNAADFQFGTGDFTIDLWAYTTALIQTNWITISDTDQWGYLLGLDTGGQVRMAFGAGTWVSTAASAGGVITTNTWQHIAMVRSSGTVKVYVDGVEKLSAAGAGNYDDTSAPFSLARWPTLVHNNFRGALDEIRVMKGTAAWTSNFTPPTAEYGGTYNYNSATYIPSGTTTPQLIIQDAGTTTNSTYMMANVSTLIVGEGTTTSVTGTSTAYNGWFTGAVRATAFNVASTEKIKENIKPIKIKPDLLDAEADAKRKYMADNLDGWLASNQARYEQMITEGGTGTVIYVDKVGLAKAYSDYIEMQWASDLNQDAYTENIQKGYEKVFWQTFDSMVPKSWNPIGNPNVTERGFVVGDVPDVVKGRDGQSINVMAFIAYMTKAEQSLKADMVFALSTLKELITTGTVTQQKIDYCNDRLEVLNP